MKLSNVSILLFFAKSTVADPYVCKWYSDLNTKTRECTGEMLEVPHKELPLKAGQCMVNPLTEFHYTSQPSVKVNVIFEILGDGTVSASGHSPFEIEHIYGCNSFGKCNSCPIATQKLGRELLKNTRDVVTHYSQSKEPYDAACVAETYSYVAGWSPNVIWWAPAEISNDDWKKEEVLEVKSNLRTG